MKNTLKMVLAFLLISSASALSIKDIAGTYKVSHPEAPVENIVTIKADGSVTLIEKSAIFGDFKCSAQATLKGSVLRSEMICENGADFVQTVNLAGVQNFEKFSAPVYSSLYEVEFDMNFERQ